MRIRNLCFVAALVASSASAATTAWAHEKGETVVKLSDIPAPARDALTREAKGSAIVRVEQEKKGGNTVYEGVVKQGDDEIGIVVDAQGAVLGRHSEKHEKNH